MAAHKLTPEERIARRCTVPDCGRDGYAFCLCFMHYSRRRKHGTTAMPSTEERFWSHVDKSGGPNACWPWTGFCTAYGYGSSRLNSQTTCTHRIAWIITHGPIPAGLFVCHRCDNPPCCNPGHFFLGTQADNIADRDAKGRTAVGPRNGTKVHPERIARGEQVYGAKLTDEQVLSIRLDSRTLAAIASDYHVTKQTIWFIRHGKTWRHLLSPF